MWWKNLPPAGGAREGLAALAKLDLERFQLGVSAGARTACPLAHAGLSRTMGRSGLRRATSVNPAPSYMDLAPNHMESSLDRPRLSTGYASSKVAPCFLA